MTYTQQQLHTIAQVIDLMYADDDNDDVAAHLHRQLLDILRAADVEFDAQWTVFFNEHNDTYPVL